ncbi:uncharacterized protein cubi_02427 [Cryptosporidium ubiquitum]|uniref:Uncharacterized protein n=1 Tax=Cryptosporidium ubiquitum TaxID=857276 RepID=A0A1J4MIB6_9CRYT|nr:uncharacterized protein cubi_02427 [Cryptosporidium ubiquitum]OII73195.1 hypothetical protein cubi_02427 [Cryptosporidium ubiquitum]
MNGKKVSEIIQFLVTYRKRSMRIFGDGLDLRAPIQPLFPAKVENISGTENSASKLNSESETITTDTAEVLNELAGMHYEWALDNYAKMRTRDHQEQQSKYPTFKNEEIAAPSPYLSYLSSQYDGIDSPIVGEILEDKHGYIVMECILLLLNQNNSIEYGKEHFKKYSSVMLLLSDILRAMKRQKSLHCDTMDFHVLVDILFREMVIMRDSGFALFEYVSCLNIVIKCIASTKEKYRWGEATSLLSVTESLIEGFGVASQ